MAAGDKRDAGNQTSIREILVDVGTQAEVATITTVERDLTVTGLLTTDMLLAVEKPTHQAGLGIAGFRIKAADTVSIIFTNPTAAGITPTADELYKITYVQYGV